jgi:hypothetical protein
MNKLYLFILLLTIILFLLPITEGFDLGFKPTSPLIGEFEYLAPIPPDNRWTQDTIDKFVDKYNSVNELSEKELLNTCFDTINGPLIKEFPELIRNVQR